MADAASVGASFGSLLRAYRIAAGLTQEELAERSGLSGRAISDQERGRTAKPLMRSVRMLADAMGLPEAQRARLASAARPTDAFAEIPATPQMPARATGRDDRPAQAAAPVPAAGQAGPLLVPRQLPAAVSHSTGRSAEAPGHQVPRQLPTPARVFVGRTRELRVLQELLMQAEASNAALVSVISGMAGVGKTALAVRWADQASDRFAGGQLYVNLRGFGPYGQPVAPGQAIRWFLDALEIPSARIPEDLESQGSLYRSLLSERRALVVLDNARDADQVRPLLPGSGRCMTVITSRSQLPGLIAAEGAHALSLDALTESDAWDLLAGRLGVEQLVAEPDAVGQLITLCARLPLALAVIAALSITRPKRSLGELAAELASTRDRLTVMSTGDVTTDMRAVFAWSYQALSRGTARVFRLLGEHPGPDITVPAVASLADVSLRHAVQALEELASASLISEHVAGRFALHDLLRAYAREVAAAHDSKQERRAAQARLFDHYLHNAASAMDIMFPAERHRPSIPRPARFAPVASADPATARAWLDSERETLVAVAAHAAGHQWPDYASGLAGTLHRYLDKGGYYADATIIHDSARRAASSARDRASEATALISLATVNGHQGRYQQGMEHLHEALAVSATVGDPVLQARILGNLGVIEFNQGRHNDADGHLREALALHRQAGDLPGEAIMLGNLGTLGMRHGRYAEAQWHAERALAICEELGNLNGKIHALNVLGETNLQSGRYLRAAGYLKKAVDLARQTGNRAGHGRALCVLGMTELRQGRHGRAAALLGQALEMLREIGERPGETAALNGLGEVHLAAGQYNAARDSYASALKLALQIRERYEQARAHDGIAAICHAEGDHGLACHHRQAALAIYSDLDMPEAEQVRSLLSSDRSSRSGGGVQDPV